MMYEQKEKEYTIEQRVAEKMRQDEANKSSLIESNKQEKRGVEDENDVVDVQRETKKLNRDIITYVQEALNAIDANGSIETLVYDERKLAENLLAK